MVFVKYFFSTNLMSYSEKKKPCSITWDVLRCGWSTGVKQIELACGSTAFASITCMNVAIPSTQIEFRRCTDAYRCINTFLVPLIWDPQSLLALFSPRRQIFQHWLNEEKKRNRFVYIGKPQTSCYFYADSSVLQLATAAQGGRPNRPFTIYLFESSEFLWSYEL